jgi:hypothetical protein
MVTLGLFFSEYPEWLNGMLEKRPPLSELQRRKPETMSLPEVLPFWTKQIGFVFPHCLVGWIFSQTIRCRTSKIYRDKLEWNGANPHKLDSARLNEDTNDIFVKLCLLIAIWHHDQVFLYASIWCWWSQSEWWQLVTAIHHAEGEGLTLCEQLSEGYDHIVFVCYL